MGRVQMNTEKMRGNKVPTVLGALSTLIALAVLLCGCTAFRAPEKGDGEAVKNVKIRVVHSGGDLKWKSAMEAVADAFMEANPGIEVELYPTQEIKNRTYFESLKVLAAQEEFYDIVEMRETKPLVEAGLLAPIPETVSSLVEGAGDNQGSCYGVPRYSTTLGMIYNKDLFEGLGIAVPRTYGDFLQACETIKQAGYQPLALGAADIWHMKFWGNYLFQNYIDPQGGTVQWNRERTEEMLADFRNLAGQGYIDRAYRTVSDSQTAQAVSSGQAAMVYTGPWMLTQIENLNPQIRLGFFFLPGKDGTAYAMQDGNVDWGISARTAEDGAKMAAAERFLQFYYSEGIYETVLETMNADPVTVRQIQMPDTKNQRIMAEAYGRQPVRTGMFLEEGRSPEGFAAYYEQLLIETLWGERLIPPLADELIRTWEGS